MTNDELLQVIERARKEEWTSLNLSDKELTSLPSEIGQLHYLTVLYIDRNRLSSIPPEIQQLQDLKELRLHTNHLTILPPEIGQLKNLTELHLQYNQLTILPSEIGKLLNLAELHLEGNQLSILPSEIGQLKNLKILTLHNNQFSTVPSVITQLQSLNRLELNNNPLSTIPPEIGKLERLTTLDLRSIKLSTVSPGIGKLHNLTTLYLHFNQLSTLSSEIGKLKSLTTLYIHNNQLFTLPPEIGELQSLTNLWLFNNRISTLPPEILKLNNLEVLYLQGNYLPIPPEILAKHNEPTTILNYYFQHIGAKERRPLNEAKMLLVGQGSVGKTSLVTRLIENKFDPGQKKTKGIKISDWKVGDVKLNIWDFGGQEIMHATHQFFLTKRSLYLLVLNAREDDYNNRIEYWLKLIESFGGDSPVIVVINKCDDNELPDFAQQVLRSKYKNIKNFVFTSCEDGRGREELIKTISKSVSKLDHVRDELPLSWFNVKNKLETLRKDKKDYISYEIYETICKNEGITDQKSPETLIGFMHDLGVALNFRDDRELMGTNVLNPEWVTNGVYKILNYHLLFKANGVLEREMLSDILQPPGYPEDKHLFIMEMMRKFELCFDFEGFANERFLIPDMLPKDETYTGEWDDEDCLCFRYNYNVLPGSIMSRFIVRSHKSIHKNTYWRNGVVLEKDGNKALVKADIEEKTISIHINGSQNTRHELLAVIRSRLKEIHGTISKLEADEKVPIPGKKDVIVDYKHLLKLERMGEINYIPEGYEGKVNVKDLLNGVESEADRRRRDERDFERRGRKTIAPPAKEPLSRKTQDYINKEALRHAKLNLWIHIFGWILTIALVVLYDQVKDISRWTYLIGCVLPLLSFLYYGITGKAYNPKTISENLKEKKRKEIFVRLGHELKDFDELMR